MTLRRRLVAQLAEVGYSPADITYLALSHYHYDHTANANDFAGATWLVRRVEHDAMFSEKPPGVTQPATFAIARRSCSRAMIMMCSGMGPSSSSQRSATRRVTRSCM